MQTAALDYLYQRCWAPTQCRWQRFSENFAVYEIAIWPAYPYLFMTYPICCARGHFQCKSVPADSPSDV